jgi:hypothetical protein
MLAVAAALRQRADVGRLSALSLRVTKTTKLLIPILAAALLVSAYPAFVLGYTWSHVARSNFPGGRDGPLDAYRHTLASAVVAFTLSPRAVEWATAAMERGTKDANLMDRRNNQIGAAIGLRAHSFGEIEPAVQAEVLRGAVNARDAVQVTWLPRERWRASRLW